MSNGNGISADAFVVLVKERGVDVALQKFLRAVGLKTQVLCEETSDERGNNCFRASVPEVRAALSEERLCTTGSISGYGHTPDAAKLDLLTAMFALKERSFRSIPNIADWNVGLAVKRPAQPLKFVPLSKNGQSNPQPTA